MPDRTDFAARTSLATLLAAGAVAVVACSGGPNDPAVFAPSAALVVEPGVTEATRISGGKVVPYTESQAEGPAIPYVSFQLAVPDGSPVLQFVSPKADVVIASDNSRLEVAAIPCRLSAANGSRTFWGQRQLTAEQYNTLRSVTVTRVYE